MPGGVWIDQNKDVKNYIWCFKWPADITQELVRFTNPEGAITNSYLKLAALVLQEATFSPISAFPPGKHLPQEATTLL